MTTCAAPGTAELAFTRAGSRTVVDRSFATSPVKLFTTRQSGDACWVYAATLGGGFVGGDRVKLTIDVGSGATALLATQASTKIYRSAIPTSQKITATVHEDALLVALPDPIVCFAGADFSQDQHYDLAPRASLVVLDWMTSGRHAVGERWAFTHYTSRIRVARAERTVMFDAVTLRYGGDTVAERMGRFDVCATCVISGPRTSVAAGAILAAVSQSPIRAHTDTIESAASIDGGALLRIAGKSVEHVGALLRERLNFLPAALGDNPWARKW